MIEVAIVEDDQREAEDLIHLLGRFSDEEREALHPHHYTDAEEFLTHYDKRFGIVFMDIEMPGVNGIEASRRLREIDPDVCLIFVTNMIQFAAEGYKFNAWDYLSKPLNYDSFVLKLRRAVRMVKERFDHPLLLKVKGGIARISSSDIVYVEVRGHRVTYHLQKTDYTVNSSLKEVAELIHGPGFALCNNCYYVNLSYVTGCKADAVTLSGHIELAMSRPKRKEFLQALNAFVGGSSL